MDESADRALAIVGIGAVLPDAPDVATFWENVKGGRYSIGEVPPGRWDPALYYDPDPAAPEKTYSKIGGWVRAFDWDPLGWRLPIPPRVVEAMDVAQQWAVACARAALLDYGHPQRPLDLARTAVVVGTAMAGDRHYLTSLRVFFPEFAQALAEAPSFAALPPAVREAIAREARDRMGERLPGISEDSMPGELANCMAGRIANLFDLHGPNFVCDAACASALAAIDAAHDGLLEAEYDAALVGGVDRNMGPAPFVKFSKIGALSATGTRPYADGADGFVMGEGAAFFLLKRLADAEAAGDRIYAVLRGVGGSSDGKGKGITAPNPVGQRLAIERAWRDAGLSPATATLIEGHGTSTRVGDVVEVETLNGVFGGFGLAPGSIALGSVKSNIGHLKGAAGAAGLLKAVLALHEKVLPPSLHCERPNPNIDFSRSPLAVNGVLRPWDATPPDGVRRAGVSAFGFGGTNYHAVLEEYFPARLAQRTSVAVPGDGARRAAAGAAVPAALAPAEAALRAPLRGALVLGAASVEELARRLEPVLADARAGRAPAPAPPAEADLRAPERLAIDYADAAELAAKAERAQKALAAPPATEAAQWRALRAQGVFRGSGPAPRVAFLYTGQGSQYANMLRDLRAAEPLVAETFAEADRVLAPLLGGPLSDRIFVAPEDGQAVARAEADLRRTEITQPAVLSVDVALTRLLASFGIVPDFVMGHSLGEYGALVAAGALPFADALEAVSARGREMASLQVPDAGLMAAVMAPLEEIERTLAGLGNEAVVANVNSTSQAVIGGATAAVERAIAAFVEAGRQVVRLPVSHAFHTSIVAPVGEPLRRTLERLHLAPPEVPLVSNVTGEFYPTGPGAVPKMIDLLAAQVASPVQFVKGLRTLHAAGARVFVEVGPKRALEGFAADVLGGAEGVLTLFTNHPKGGDAASFNQALCGLYAAGLGVGRAESAALGGRAARAAAGAASGPVAAGRAAGSTSQAAAGGALPEGRYAELGRMLAEVLERGAHLLRPDAAAPPADPPVVTGAALGLPGRGRVFDDRNVERILDGEQEIDLIPTRLRHAMVEKHITRLVKEGGGGPRFEAIDGPGEVIKLAARAGSFDLEREYGVPDERAAAFDSTTRLALAAGLDALRDAGIPLVLRHRPTTKGTWLPDRWMLPEALRDETGVIFASAFPGYDSFAGELARYHEDHARLARIELLRALRERARESDGESAVLTREIERRLHELEREQAERAFAFDRRFLFRVLPMGHSQFAEYVGARGPNTHVNSACASTTQALALAQDWIAAGRCRRVVVIAADDVTTDRLMEWIGSGFLATGAAATDDVVEEAALPFDRRRHGTILGMGAAGVVVERPDCARERGLRPICEVVSTVTANSAFHGTRLDVEHIASVMERLVAQAERRTGVVRAAIARELVFVSHETYTPARGGSASAEVEALRRVFGEAAATIVIANTKGLTGHPMGVGIEDVVAIKALETGVVPPVPNFREVDPELGPLHLSRGGTYPIRWALRLGAGFGSQISMALLRWTPTPDGARPAPDALGYETRIADRAAFQHWLEAASGQAGAELEVVDRTLRVRDAGRGARLDPAPAAAPAPRPSAAPSAAATTLPPPSAAAAPAAAPLRPAAAAGAPAPGSPPAPAPPPPPPRGGGAGGRAASPRGRRGAACDGVRPDPGCICCSGPRGRRRRGRRAGARAGDRGGEDRLSGRDAGRGSRPRGGSRHRHGEAGRDLRGAARGVGDPARREPAPARLPDPRTRDPLRARAPARRRTGCGGGAGRGGVRRPATHGAPPPAATPAPGASAPASADDDEAAVRARVLAIVAEKTGYPVEMLDVDLDLEADLGIDTVKQAETFAALREAWGIPRDENLRLRDYPTLAHAIRFVRERRPVAAAPAAEPAVAAAPDAESGAGDEFPRRLVVAVPRAPLERFRPTGVALGAAGRVVVVADRGGVGAALARALAEEGATALVIEGAPAAAALEAQLAAFAAGGAVTGVYWLPALDADPADPDPAGWREALRGRVKLLYTAMRALVRDERRPAPFLVSGVRLGGRFGYDPAGARHPLGGAVVGFTKAYRREHPEVLAKAVDFAPDGESEELARLLLAETQRDPGVVEVGWCDGERWTVGWREEPAPTAAGGGRALGRDSVFVVTGAAGSIVSAIVADLAAASGGTFHLLDRVAAPDPADPDLARFSSDREGLRLALFERMKARGERATPAAVERALAALERAAAGLAAIRAVEAAGGTAHWHAVDLCDADAVAGVLRAVGAAHGRVDVLLHAAGLEVSRRLADKEPAEFERVFDVKADGWHHLLRGLGALPLGAAVVFSSIAGRFGNGGQTDYSAANDLLCKSVSWLRAARPGCLGIALDWTAWSQIGMASRGSIPRIMQRAGIDMLPPEVGVPIVRRELGAGSGEIVVAGRLGILAAPWAEDGGVPSEPLDPAAGGPLTGRLAAVEADGCVVVETTLEPARQPFLDHHRIEGVPVLPGVMGIEAFAEVAALVRPGWHVAAVEDAAFLAPFKFYRDAPRALRLEGRPRAAGGDIVVDCALLGERALPGRAEPRRTVHFTARVRLAREPAALSGAAPGPAPDGGVGPDAVYRLYFHGPAYRVVAAAARDGAGLRALLADGLPANHAPAGTPLRTPPRLLELCFQAAGLLALADDGALALPQGFARMRFAASAATREPAGCAARVVRRGDAFDAVVMDAAGQPLLVLEGYRTIALPGAAEAGALAALRAALGPREGS